MGQEISCILGCLKHERRFEQNIKLEIEFQYDFASSVKSDFIGDAIDYSQVLEKARKVLVGGKYQLLERAAHDLLDMLFSEYPVLFARVHIEKPNILPEGQTVAVELSRYLSESPK